MTAITVSMIGGPYDAQLFAVPAERDGYPSPVFRVSQLTQPVSYWRERDAWINSPSYPDGTASFERPVPPRQDAFRRLSPGR